MIAAAEVTLKLVFAGLIAFTPSNPSNVGVVLIGTGEPYYASDHCALHSHKPVLVYEKRNAVGNCTDEAGVFAGEQDQICSLLLAREDIKFHSPDTAATCTYFDFGANSYIAKMSGIA